LTYIGQPAETLDRIEGKDDCGWRQVVHPDDYDRLAARWLHSLKTGEPFESEHRIRRFDGIYRWFRNAGMPSRDDHGRVVGWCGTMNDIEGQRQAEAALRDRERELSQLVDMVPSHLWRLTPEGEPIFFNKRMVDFLGLDVADTSKPGMSRLEAVIETVVHPDDAAQFRDALSRSLASGEGFVMRYRLRRADGVYRWMSSRAEPMRDHGGRIVHWYGLCHDIDDQMLAEEALRRARDKLARATQAASLSELSASIAHEVNQPLAAIVATCHACRRWLSADPPNLERAKMTLERIIRDANSASEDVGRIRALFSQMDKTRSPTDITQVIAEVCQLMAEELARKNIRVETDFYRSLPQVLIDPVQMEQVLINLLRNAIDALGTIVDGTKLIQVRAVLDGDNTIRVEVRDVGPGMKEPERIFEPFFTTKENGMGMGLAICRSIIESHNGRLWAISNQPRGTILAFSLPIQARDAA
jgi:PAS domain S-box-containing protein